MGVPHANPRLMDTETCPKHNILVCQNYFLQRKFDSQTNIFAILILLRSDCISSEYSNCFFYGRWNALMPIFLCEKFLSVSSILSSSYLCYFAFANANLIANLHLLYES
jgi:hypothetical protein